MRRNNTVWGLILIVVGCAYLVNNIFGIHLFSMSNLWPIFVLGAGLAFEMSYFTYRRAPGLLVPGGILTTIGLLFFFHAFTGWGSAVYTWPVYQFAVAVGLFQLYLALPGRPKGLLIPVFILTFISAFSFAALLFHSITQWVNFNIAVGAAIVLAGVYVLYKNTRT